MIKHICDFCGQETDYGYKLVSNYPNGLFEDEEICYDCLSKLKELIRKGQKDGIHTKKSNS